MRIIIPILAVFGVIALLVVLKFSQISMLIKAGEAGQKAGPPPDTVSTVIATKQTWEATIHSIGTVAASRGVTVSNDAPGVVAQILFESGAIVKQGQVLVILDSRVERAQLASAHARRELANQNAGRSRTLAGTDSIPKAQLDTDEAQLKSSGADLDALQAQIDRKVVRAPFAGRLGIRSINLGQYLNPGTPITVLEAMDSVYIDFTLPQQRLPDVPVGTVVRIQVEGIEGGPIDGTVAALDPTVDVSSRAIKLRAAVSNKGQKLRAGMFARVDVVLNGSSSVIAVPATAIIHASYGDSVFVAEAKPDGQPHPDGKVVKSARQQFVRLGENRGDFVAIEDGVKEGEEIVTIGAFKLRNGGGVIVDNSINLNPQLAPHPENR